MNEVTATFLGAIIGVFGTLLGSYFSIKFQAERTAKSEFYSSVHEILSGLFPEPLNWPKDSFEHLQKLMPDMQIAVKKLRFHLPQKKLVDFDDAWRKYKEWCYQLDDTAIKNHLLYPESIDQKVVFKRHVETLLAYATRT